MVNACWVKGTSPYAKSYDNRGRPCKVYGTTDYVVAIAVFVVLALVLIILGVGWVIRYSRKASKFRAFWNQPSAQDYELKQHHDSLLHGNASIKGDDASSIRSKMSVGTVPKSTSTGRHGRSPLSTYVPDEDISVGDRQYLSAGYGEGGMGLRDQAQDFPARQPTSPLAQSQPYNQPWQNFSTRNDLGYPSTSQVNLHAPSAQDERSGFLHDDGGRNSYDAYGGGGVGGRLPDIGSFNPGGPGAYSNNPFNSYGGPSQQQPPQQQYATPYGNSYGPR